MANSVQLSLDFPFIGSCLPMVKVFNTIQRLANSHASVLIMGESGTGKELCAKAIHQNSQRQHQAFIALNCAAIPSNLIESELFGHIKGAFTSADKNRQGAAALADNGTLFLDEIGEMQLELQAKLLRFVETGGYYRVGDSQIKQANIRFIAATNQNPLAAIENGSFRSDLYYRLKVVAISLPPLRQRKEDIVQLAQYFLDKYSILEAKPQQTLLPLAQRILTEYHWPGNVRQLKNLMHNVIIFNDYYKVDVEIINELLSNEPIQPEKSHQNQARNLLNQKPSPFGPLCLIERDAIEGALAYCSGDVSKAALLLCISKSTLYNRMKCWKQWGRKCESCTVFNERLT